MATAFPTRTLPDAARAWGESDARVPPRSYRADVRGRLVRNRAGTISFSVLVLLVLGCASAGLLTSYDPTAGEVVDRLLPLGSRAPVLGRDDQGSDMLARLLYGGQLSLLAGFAPVLIATAIGTTLGAFAGYVGRPGRGRVEGA